MFLYHVGFQEILPPEEIAHYRESVKQEEEAFQDQFGKLVSGTGVI